MNELARVIRNNLALTASGIAIAAAGGYLGYDASEGAAMYPMQSGAEAEGCAHDVLLIASGGALPKTCGKLAIKGVDVRNNIVLEPAVANADAMRQADHHYAEAGDIRESEMDTQMDVATAIWILFIISYTLGNPARAVRTNER